MFNHYKYNYALIKTANNKFVNCCLGDQEQSTIIQMKPQNF